MQNMFLFFMLLNHDLIILYITWLLSLLRTSQSKTEDINHLYFHLEIKFSSALILVIGRLQFFMVTRWRLHLLAGCQQRTILSSGRPLRGPSILATHNFSHGKSLSWVKSLSLLLRIRKNSLSLKKTIDWVKSSGIISQQ